MLLSLDRVLQLLSEGKSISKIAELANCNDNDVIDVIQQARNIINKYEKKLARKKIIIKKITKNDKKINKNDDDNSIIINEILKGAELSAVPLESTLIIYSKGTSIGDPGPSGIGLVIYDKENRQVGKVTSYIGNTTERNADYKAIIKALKIAFYFKTKNLKIRTDSELIIKQINGEYEIESERVLKYCDEIDNLIKNIGNCKFDFVKGNLNEKAKYLSMKAVSKKY